MHYALQELCIISIRFSFPQLGGDKSLPIIRGYALYGVCITRGSTVLYRATFQILLPVHQLYFIVHID